MEVPTASAAACSLCQESAPPQLCSQNKWLTNSGGTSASLSQAAAVSHYRAKGIPPLICICECPAGVPGSLEQMVGWLVKTFQTCRKCDGKRLRGGHERRALHPVQRGPPHSCQCPARLVSWSTCLWATQTPLSADLSRPTSQTIKPHCGGGGGRHGCKTQSRAGKLERVRRMGREKVSER